MRGALDFKDLVSQVLTFDYLGALASRSPSRCCSCRSSGWCAPASFFGLLNALRRGLGALAVPRRAAPRSRAHALACALTLVALLVAAFAGADRLTTLAEDRIYADQRRLQRDHALPAHRRHARPRRLAPVPQRQPAVPLARRVPLPRGAGAPRAGGPRRAAAACWSSAAATGWRCARCCATRASSSVTLVDLDPDMTRLFSTDAGAGAAQPPLAALAQGARRQRRRVRLAGAARRRRSTSIVVDFPDPEQLRARQALHRRRFYELLDRHLAAERLAVVQTTSPLVARRASGPW